MVSKIFKNSSNLLCFVLSMLKPQRIHNSCVKSDHKRNRKESCEQEPSHRIGLPYPLFRVNFSALMFLLVIFAKEEHWNVHNDSKNPRTNYNHLKIHQNYSPTYFENE